MSKTSTEIEIPEEPEATVSEVLVAAREALGLSQKDVADQLFLTSTFIRYLDDADFEKIPKPAFIKGYLRSYARVVGLTGDEVVALYEAGLQNDLRVEVRDVTEERVGSASLTGPVLQTGLVGLVVILVVCALVWIVASGDGDQDNIPVAPVLEPAVETGANPEMEPFVEPGEQPDLVPLSESPVGRLLDGKPLVAAVGDREMAMEPMDNAGDEARGATAGRNMSPLSEADVEPASEAEGSPNRGADADSNVDVGRETADSDDAGSAQSAVGRTRDVTIERSSNGNYRYITVDAGGFDQIEMAVTDECWIEVQDGDGQSIYADLNRADDILTVYGVPPFEILLGNASAVSLEFNSASIDLARYTARDQTAKLTLGDDG